MKKLFSMFALLALVGLFSTRATAQSVEVCSMENVCSDFGMNNSGDYVTIYGGTLFYDGVNFSVSNMFEDNYHYQAGKDVDGYGLASVGSHFVDLSYAIQGSTNPRDPDGGTPANTLQVPASGAVLHIHTSAPGKVLVFSKLAINKQYVVWENGMLHSYDIALQNSNASFADGQTPLQVSIANDLTVYTSTGNVYTATDFNNQIKQIRQYFGNETVSGNNEGVIAFDVKADADYLVHASGAKIVTTGVVFVPQGMDYSTTIWGENVSSLSLYTGSLLPAMYLIGNCATSDWNPATSMRMTMTAPGVYECDETLTGEGTSYFCFSSSNSDDWADVNAYRYAGSNDDYVAMGATAPITAVGVDGTCFTATPGAYHFVLNLINMTVTLLPAGGETATPEDLTLNVQVPAGTDRVYLTGNFNSWSDFVPMVQVDDTHFTLRLQQVYRGALEYKYLCRGDWDFEENRVPNHTYQEADTVIAWRSIAGGTEPMYMWPIQMDESAIQDYYVMPYTSLATDWGGGSSTANFYVWSGYQLYGEYGTNAIGRNGTLMRLETDPNEGWCGAGFSYMSPKSICVEALRQAIVAHPEHFYLHMSVRTWDNVSHTFRLFDKAEASFVLGTQDHYGSSTRFYDVPRDAQWHEVIVPLADMAAYFTEPIPASGVNLLSILSEPVYGGYLTIDQVYILEDQTPNYFYMAGSMNGWRKQDDYIFAEDNTFSHEFAAGTYDFKVYSKLGKELNFSHVAAASSANIRRVGGLENKIRIALSTPQVVTISVTDDDSLVITGNFAPANVMSYYVNNDPQMAMTLGEDGIYTYHQDSAFMYSNYNFGWEIYHAIAENSVSDGYFSTDGVHMGYADLTIYYDPALNESHADVVPYPVTRVSVMLNGYTTPMTLQTDGTYICTTDTVMINNYDNNLYIVLEDRVSCHAEYFNSYDWAGTGYYVATVVYQPQTDSTAMDVRVSYQKIQLSIADVIAMPDYREVFVSGIGHADAYIQDSTAGIRIDNYSYIDNGYFVTYRGYKYTDEYGAPHLYAYDYWDYYEVGEVAADTITLAQFLANDGLDYYGKRVFFKDLTIVGYENEMGADTWYYGYGNVYVSDGVDTIYCDGNYDGYYYTTDEYPLGSQVNICGTGSKNYRGSIVFNAKGAIYDMRRLTLLTVGNGRVDVKGRTATQPEYEFTKATRVTLQAVPDAGYYFTGWADGFADSERYIYMNEDTTLVATFAPNDFTLTASAANEQQGWVEQAYAYLSQLGYANYVMVAAYPREGYTFKEWSDGSTEQYRTMQLTSDSTITAIFAPNEVQVSVNAYGNGLVEGAGRYYAGEEFVITAIPNTGYRVSDWYVRGCADWEVDGNELHVTACGNVQVEAYFSRDIFTVSLSCDSVMGFVYPNDNATYLYGDYAYIDAYSRWGYRFKEWSDGNTDQYRSIRMTSNLELTAIFVPDTFYVEALCDSIMGTTTGTGRYAYLSEATLVAQAREGYHFVMWSDSVLAATRTDSVWGYTYLTAIFAPNTYKVTVVTDPTVGKLAISSEFEYGTTLSFTADTVYGFDFQGWSDGVATLSRSLVVISDTTITANFTRHPFDVTLRCSAEEGEVIGAGTYLYEDEVTIKAVAKEGYEFVQWSDGDTAAERTFYLEGDVVLEAHFVKVVSALDNAEVNAQVEKIFRNGHVFIRTQNGTYTVLGSKL